MFSVLSDNVIVVVLIESVQVYIHAYICNYNENLLSYYRN